MTYHVLSVCCVFLRLVHQTHSITTFKCLEVSQDFRVNGTLLLTTEVTSRFGCASECTKNAECFYGQYFAETKLCEQYAKNQLVYWIQPPNMTSSSTLRKSGDIADVVIVRRAGGLSHADSAAACRLVGGTLATYAQINTSFHASPRLHIADCCHSEIGIHFILQYQIDGTGPRGISECFWTKPSDKHNALCFLP